MASEGLKEAGGPVWIGIFWQVGANNRDFLNRLVEGLLRLQAPLEIVLSVRPEDNEEIAGLRGQFGGKLHVIPQFDGDSPFPRWLLIVLAQFNSWRQGFRAKKPGYSEAIGRFRNWVAQGIRGFLRRVLSRFRKSPIIGLPLLAFGVILAAFVFLIYWTLYGLRQLLNAARETLLLPWIILNRLERFRRLIQAVKARPDPLILAKEAGCDVWLIPSPRFGHSLTELNAPTIVLIPESAGWEGEAPAVSRLAEATLCVSTSSAVQDQPWRRLLKVDAAKVRQIEPLPVIEGETDAAVRQKAQKQLAQRWLALFREAVEVARWQSTFDRRLMEPWPRLETVPASPRDPLKVFLFLPQIYYGGILQVTRELVSELTAINGERRRLDLTLGLLEGQGNTDFVERLGNAVAFRRMRLNPIRREEVTRLCGGPPAWLADRPEQEFCFFSGAAQAAFQADAWFSLIDRFPLPLLPARPLGILVQDVLQRRHPEVFNGPFFRSMMAGIIPTARSAEVIVTGTPQTRDDVIAVYGLEPARVRLVPVACNPHWHFNQVTPQPVDGVQEPFILNVTNAALHKGTDVLLRGYAQLKRRLGSRTPQLVVCGYATQGYSPSYWPPHDLPIWKTTRQLVLDLDLQEGRDLAFLGTVGDDELRYLYEHCSAVINSALYDNGCLCLAEGAYFGKPAVSSRYPAAEFHAYRFGYRAHFFPVGDAEGLMEAVSAALLEPPATADDLQRAQARFFDPEFSFRRYGERFYDVLVQLAEQGRRQKATSELRQSA